MQVFIFNWQDGLPVIIDDADAREEPVSVHMLHGRTYTGLIWQSLRGCIKSFLGSLCVWAQQLLWRSVPVISGDRMFFPKTLLPHEKSLHSSYQKKKKRSASLSANCLCMSEKPKCFLRLHPEICRFKPHSLHVLIWGLHWYNSE